MTYRTVIVAVSSLSVFGCTHSEPLKMSAPLPAEGKQVAPVVLDAELSEGSAKVTLRFEAEASAVKVNVWGVDGLVVRGEQVIVSEGAFKRSETKSFQVAFTPGTGRSHLVVGVSGMFNGAKRDRVATFALGTPTQEQLDGPGTKITTDDGQHIKLMPAKQE